MTTHRVSMHRTNCYESPRITSIEIGKFRVIIISHVSEDDTVLSIGPSSGSLSSERDNKGANWSKYDFETLYQIKWSFQAVLG